MPRKPSGTSLKPFSPRRTHCPSPSGWSFSMDRTRSIWWESFGLVISEAWMFKRPVIASNVGGPKERVSHGKDGLLFEVGDARALAQVMRRACTEKGLWDRLVRNITPPPAERVMTEAFLQ